jgi:hypothetical protein
MNLCVVPLALFAARRVGRITHLSLLVAGVVLALLGWCVVVFALNSIAASTGGRFGWEDLLNPGNWRNTVFGSLVVIAAPQIWLLLFNAIAPNDSSKSSPLRSSV